MNFSKIGLRWAVRLNNAGYFSLAVGAVSGVFGLFAPALFPTLATVVFTVIGVALTYVANEAKGQIDQGKLEKARVDIATANTRADQAMASAEAERAERAKIERRLADRELSAQDADSIAKAVQPFAGQEYKVTTFWDLREPHEFTNKVHHALIAGGWIYTQHETGSFLLGGLEGVEIYAHPGASDQTRQAADQLVKILGDLELHAKRKDAGGEVHAYISMNVGTKPLWI